MTSTDRKVTRVTSREYGDRVGVSGRGYGKPRRIAVTIMPGDTIGLRPLRTKRTVYIGIEQVYRYAVRLAAFAAVTDKRNAKRRAK